MATSNNSITMLFPKLSRIADNDRITNDTLTIFALNKDQIYQIQLRLINILDNKYTLSKCKLQVAG